MIEFKTYQRIVEGDLRPNLRQFSTKEGIENLRKSFFSSQIKVQKGFDAGNILETFDLDFIGIKDGDEVIVDIPDEDEVKSPEIKISINERDGEEELINLDIPPPEDEKSELFLRIIECEYNRIKSAIKKQFESIESNSELTFYVTKNIQFAKRISKEAHLQHKRYKLSSGEEWDNPNSYILFCLKKYLVYTIGYIQELCFPLLDKAIQPEYELIDELYDFEHSRMMSSVKNLSSSMEEIQRSNYWKNLGEGKTVIEQKKFFIEKIQDHLLEMKKAKNSVLGLSNHYHTTLRILETEYSKILYSEEIELLSRKKFSNTKEKYNFILTKRTDLSQKKSSNTYKYLKMSGFIDFLDLEIDKLEKTLKYGLDIYLKERIFLEELYYLLIILQGRKYLGLRENWYNDYLVDLLRAREYYVADQTRQGRSGTDNFKNYDSGELDITIRSDKNLGNIITIIEAFELVSCGEKNEIIQKHINKLITRYDTGGNKENYIIVYAKAKKFNQLWLNYKKFMKENIFTDSSIKEIEKYDSKSDLKVGVNIYSRQGKDLEIYHLFVNMHPD